MHAIIWAVTSKGGQPFDFTDVFHDAGFLQNFLGQPMLSKYLHCALIEIVRLWQIRGLLMALEEDVVDSLIRQYVRQSQTAA